MSNLEKRVMERNYKKRFIAIVIAAVIMVVLSTGLFAILFSTQISEANTLIHERIYEEWSKDSSDDADRTSEFGSRYFNNRHFGKRHFGREILSQLTPIPTATKVVFVILALLWAVLGIFYWISVIEWLYKAAVSNNMNRALWPLLGAFFTLIPVMVLLVIINNPRRGQHEVNKSDN